MANLSDLLETDHLLENEVRLFSHFLQTVTPDNDKRRLLEAIPTLESPSHGPLSTLGALLQGLPGRWPILEVQQKYNQLWKQLPEDSKSGHSVAGHQHARRVLQKCKGTYRSLLDLLQPMSHAPALIDPESGRHVSHSSLAESLRTFGLPLQIQQHLPRPVVAISLPNGPLLAMTVLATASYYTAAPVAHGTGVGAEQFKSDVLQSGTSLVIAQAGDVQRLGLRDSWTTDAGINVVLAELDNDMRLTLRDLEGSIFPPISNPTVPNTPDDTGILLFTSGTSGTKKLVPLSVHSMVCGVAMVIDSWGLSPSMRCLNQMPLNHVGGLIRNLFAPVISGGSVICCSAFDANAFWDCVEDYAPTWYYASPSMHQCILEAGADRPESVEKSQIRLVCNAAGGLLPSLACQIRDAFSSGGRRCIVLPSYGMTECMPISTPPLDYQLQKTGTSGVSVGPEIAILDGSNRPAETRDIGRVSVRGSPVFAGYLKAGNVIDKSCFTANGFFDTGDMGYVDSEGYLFITGRSKEVINRGGELISPFEVEDAVVAAASDPASPTAGRISKALALSVNHDVLQEVVGIAVVVPENVPRPSLRDVQDSVKSSLSSVKVPVLIVYMEGGLPTNNNKVLRIKLAERLDLPAISDATLTVDRLFEAVCPPPNTPLSQKVASRKVLISHETLLEAATGLLGSEIEVCVPRVQARECHPDLWLAPKETSASGVTEELAHSLLQSLRSQLDGYNLPSTIKTLQTPFARKSNGSIDESCLGRLPTAEPRLKGSQVHASSTVAIVAGIFAEILALPSTTVNAQSDFFELGGDSMRAGKLLSALRKEFKIRLPIDALFINRKVADLAVVIEEKMGSSKEDPRSASASTETDELLPGCEETCSSTNPIILAIQLLPMVIFFPAKRALTWTFFVYFLAYTQRWYTNDIVLGRLVNLVVSLLVANAAVKLITPFLAIAFKWIIIGRYREGLYPMWSSYHTRWWICQKAIGIAGKGAFNLTDTSRVWYYRLMGAKIGNSVTIAKGATLGEYDLLTIEDNAVLERCIVRPFAAERNTSMYLGRITLGANSSIGLASIVAAGTNVPANACIGPNSSSWEIKSAEEANRDLAASRIPAPHWSLQLFLGLPIRAAVEFIGILPWLACLVALVRRRPDERIPDAVRAVILWFAYPERVGYHYLAFAAHATFGPAFYFAAVLFVKKAFDLFMGTIKSSSTAQRSSLEKFRLQLIQDLMPAPRFHKLSELFGSHYEATSVMMRALGAKVGQRVYWPGTGPSIQNHDLLEVGDDVVFGSRASIVTSDGTGTDRVRIGDSAMVADRVVLLPGSSLGEKTIMGSGALTKRNAHYPSETTWVGSKNGEAICLTSGTLANTTVPGKRASKYYDDLKAPEPNFLSMNSSATTLVKSPNDSEVSTPSASRSDLLEKGFTEHPAQPLNKNVAPRETHSNPEPPTETLSPFGRAFYQNQAPYRVWSQTTISLYSTLIIATIAIYWNVPSISAVQICANVYKNSNTNAYLLETQWYRPLGLYLMFGAIISILMTAQSVLVLALIVAAKWLLLGRRKPGNYDWDKSPYCQRWQLFLKIETLRRHCYGGHGILGLLTGSWWIATYFRALGASLGNDVALFAGGAPSLMFTEPDLLTLGDRVAVDDASLVGHVNTRGKFDLNELSVGDRSVLRSGSRLLSGAKMEADSCLLEHTLVMAGDVVEAGSTSQGWPAEEFRGPRMPTMKAKRVWGTA
ncbi:hypothetical protein MBLNU230_g3880t1 [Neophaeotheca triangularis]